MEKRGLSGFSIFMTICLLLILLILVLFIILGDKNYDEAYEEKVISGEIVNPVGNLTIEEAVAKFDENFVFYILYSIKAYNLHEPSLSSDKPKIEFFVDEDIYNAVIDNGEILVSKKGLQEKDIIIKTTKEEAVMMIEDQSYIPQSFSSGGSSIELVAGKFKLFSKGYLKLYTDLTGESITGLVFKGF